MYFTTAVDVALRMSERGVSLRLSDNPQAISQCLREATSFVLKQLLPQYNQSDLQADALSGGPDGSGGMVKDLTTDIAVCKLAARRGNAISQTFKDICKEAKETLQDLNAGPDVAALPNVPLAQPHYPTYSNMRIIPGYIYAQSRVEVTISDNPPTSPGYAQKIDWFSAFFVEY